MPNHIQNRLRVIGNNNEVKEVLTFISSTDEEGKAVQIDFNKIKPMPKGLEANPHSGIETWVKICTGQLDFKALIRNASAHKSYGEVWTEDKDNNGFNNMLNYMETSTAFETLIGERDRKNVKDFDEEDFNTFIQCLKNYRQYGYTSWYKWSSDNWGTKWNAYGQNDERNTDDTIHFETAWASPVELIKELSAKFPHVKLKLDYSDEDSGSNTGRLTIKNGKIIKEMKPESQSKEGYEIYFELHPDSVSNYKFVNGQNEYVENED